MRYRDKLHRIVIVATRINRFAGLRVGVGDYHAKHCASSSLNTQYISCVFNLRTHPASVTI